MIRPTEPNLTWPFNPNFPKAFSFPAFGGAAWLALALWRDCKGDATKKIKADVNQNWQTRWFLIFELNHGAAHCRFLNRMRFANANAAESFGVGDWQGTPAKSSVISSPDTKHFSLTKPGEWVETLLNADWFWWFDINAWAFERVEEEFRILSSGRVCLATYGIGIDTDGRKAKQCEHFCYRFYDYQQVRYRYHEHLLEKHCERALGGRALNGYNPKTASEARATLIGWLSKQRGYATNPLVKEFRRAVRAKNSALSLNEKKAFDAERKHPSNRRYRITRSAPLRPDEMGWLILTWPVWNFSRWRWTDVAEAVIKKFEFVDAKGKPLDFLKTSRKRFYKELRKNSDASGSMPAEKALALFCENLFDPTPKEKEMHEDWERTVRSRRSKAFEKLCRLAIGGELEKQILSRPIGRGTDKKPPLWDLAQQIAV